MRSASVRALMLRLALKMLFGDRAKYLMLVCGLTFCSLLMTQQSSVFCGLMRWTTATIRNVGAPIWVSDAKVEQVNEVVPIREIEVERVRSVPGVEWAVPLYWGIIQTRPADGSFLAVQILGIDSASLIGKPQKMIEGRVEDLRLPNAVIVDQVAVQKFRQKGVELKMNSTFEVNDQEARVVGICDSERSFMGQPYIYSTYHRALEYVPNIRKMLSFVLVKARDGTSEQRVIADIEALGGLKARTKHDFFWTTIWWYVRNTGIAISFGTVVIIGCIVGIAIAGQTFYLFIHENIRYLAALKAMGAGTWLLARMVFLQAFTVGFIGYGFGAGFAAIFGNGVLKKGEPPFYMPPEVLIYAGCVVVGICLLAGLFGLIRVIRAEPAVVFR